MNTTIRLRFLRTRQDLEQILQHYEYERKLFYSSNLWDRLEALYFLELEGFVFSRKLLCELLREWGESICQE